MRKLLPPALALFLVLTLRCAAAEAAAVAPADAKLFEYDRSAPLEVREVGTEERDGAVIRDVTFRGVQAPVKAFVVAPAKAPASVAGILYAHWLGEPTSTNRTEFLHEAVALSGEGIVSVLVDAMWSEPKWYANRLPEEDYDRSVRQVVELRRAMDLLLAQPGVDPKRVAFVGHDFGAMYGAVMGAVDQRASTYVLMAGTPHFIDWFLFARKPQDADAYRRKLAPLDPINFVAQLAPAPVFFQFASHDEYVSLDAASLFYGAARPRKQTAMYDAAHDLRNPDATADRVTWLIRQLGAKR